MKALALGLALTLLTSVAQAQLAQASAPLPQRHSNAPVDAPRPEEMRRILGSQPNAGQSSVSTERLNRVQRCRTQAARETAAAVEDIPPGSTRAPEFERLMRAKICLQKAAQADEAELMQYYHPEIDDQLARAARGARK